jgi:hypothetical protein
LLRPLALLIALLPPAFAAMLPACAQDAPGAPSGYTVRGTVVNSATNQAVARALVSLAQNEAVLTDSNGQFSFGGVEPGSYSITVTKPGYQSRSRSQPAQIQVGPDMPSVALSITPLATITGHITLSTADQADGFRIQAFLRKLRNGRPQWTVAGEARTRSDGSFRIANLEPGDYRIVTMASLDRPGPALNASGPVWGYPSLYYPGTTNVSGAGIISLGAGQQAEADISVVRQQFFPVVGIVQGSAGADANFEILDSGGRETGLAVRFERQDETIHAAVPNGTWTLEARVSGEAMEFGSTTFQVNGAPVSFAIGLQTVPHIPIVIHRDFSNSATAQSAGRGPGMNIELTSTDEMLTDFGGGMGRVRDRSGSDSWQLRVVKPGRYWAQAQAWPPTYVSSITSGGVDLGSNPLVVMPGSTPPAVEVTLRDDGGTISGVVGSQAPGAANAAIETPQVWIYAIPLFSTATALRDVMPNSDGHFSFYAMAPGSYRVIACDAPQEIDFHSAEGLAAYAGKGQTVTVDPNGTASVQLDVVHIAQQGAP